MVVGPVRMAIDPFQFRVGRKTSIIARRLFVVCLPPAFLPSPQERGGALGTNVLKNRRNTFAFPFGKQRQKIVSVKKTKFSLRVLYKRVHGRREKKFSPNCCPANRQTGPKDNLCSPYPAGPISEDYSCGKKKWGKTERENFSPPQALSNKKSCCFQKLMYPFCFPYC